MKKQVEVDWTPLVLDGMKPEWWVEYAESDGEVYLRCNTNRRNVLAVPVDAWDALVDAVYMIGMFRIIDRAEAREEALLAQGAIPPVGSEDVQQDPQPLG